MSSRGGTIPDALSIEEHGRQWNAYREGSESALDWGSWCISRLDSLTAPCVCGVQNTTCQTTGYVIIPFSHMQSLLIIRRGANCIDRTNKTDLICSTTCGGYD